MNISKVSFDKIQALAYKDVFYQHNSHQLREFIQFAPTLDGLSEAIEARGHHPIDRTLLVNTMASQYANLDTSEIQYQNIYKLKDENTFTVITAHQPALVGGPAYYFYKIFSTINLANQLNQQHPNCNFVPVFINGAEDHDFDEIKSVNLFGKTITWDTDQSGPVGRFSTLQLSETLLQIKEILGDSPQANQIFSIFDKAAKNATSYNDFVLSWVNDFFSEYGVLVFNMDHADLKKAFIPIMEKEIIHKISESHVQKTQEQLQQFGFKPQAFARDINLFYINGASRERIIYENSIYKVNNQDITFTEQEIIDHLHQFPERFSPNVILRPLYQEYILPNIAYIGGGGELAYWLERKSQFAYFGVFYPVLIRRNSVMIIPKSIQKLMEKLHLTEEDILLDDDKLITLYLEKNTGYNFHLNSEIEQTSKIFDAISETAKSIDPTLEMTVKGEGHKVAKILEGIESRLKRVLKQKEETNIQQIRTLKNKLFPNHGLQERTDSYLQFLVTDGPELTKTLISNLNPLEKDFLIFYL